jgi:anti-sigma factor RsiW
VSSKQGAACRNLRDRITAYVDGDLAAVDCRRIERHCRECPECAAFVEGLRRTIGLCREAGRAPLPEAVRASARARVRQLLDAKSDEARRTKEPLPSHPSRRNA